MKDSTDREKATGFWFYSILKSVLTFHILTMCILQGKRPIDLTGIGSVLVFKNLLRKLGEDISLF